MLVIKVINSSRFASMNISFEENPIDLYKHHSRFLSFMYMDKTTIKQMNRTMEDAIVISFSDGSIALTTSF